MLYSGENGNNTSFRGKTWKLTNGYTRGCNYAGQQCTFKLENEAIRFSVKDKPKVKLDEAKFAPGDKVEVSGGSGIDSYARGTVIPTNKVKTDGRGVPTNIRGAYQVPNWKKEVPIQLDGGDIIVMFNNRVSKVNEGLKRQQTRYRPELSRREMETLVANLKKQGYKATASGPNLKTDATDKAIDMAEGVGYKKKVNEDATTAGSLRKQLRSAQFKKVKQVPAGLSSYVNPALQDIWVRGNVVVLTNGILWNAYTDDGGSIGGGTDRDKIMNTLNRSSWTNF